VPDDWELDDWENEAFDEDVWDASQVDDGAGLFNDAVVAGSVPLTYEAQGGGRMAWNAWDVGTVFALGGWLADHHAEQTARQVAAALAERGTAAPAVEGPRGAAHPPPASGIRYGAVPGTLTVGDGCDPGVLFAELQAASSAGHDLMLWLQGPGGATGPVSLVISAVPRTGGPQLWVVAEEAISGFAAGRLVPVFEPEPHGRLALFATDHPHEAVDAAVWACQRAGVTLDGLTVTERRPDPSAGRVRDRPEPRLIRSAEDAGAAACAWMRGWGFDDATVTDPDLGGVVAVVSSEAVATVDAGVAPVDAAAVQAIADTAAAKGLQALVFALAGFTKEGLERAVWDEVSCFEFDLQGQPEAINAPAAWLSIGEADGAAGGALLQPGEPVDPDRLAATLYDALVIRELAWASGHLHNSWTNEPVVWHITIEDETGAYLSLYPLTLDRRWIREPHPSLSRSWKKHSVIDYAQQKLGAPFGLERAWNLVESESKYDAITYSLAIEAGDIETTLHLLATELETAMRAFGTRLETTTLTLGRTALEEGNAFADALERSQPRT
jgi:hypothetical protein